MISHATDANLCQCNSIKMIWENITFAFQIWVPVQLNKCRTIYRVFLCFQSSQLNVGWGVRCLQFTQASHIFLLSDVFTRFFSVLHRWRQTRLLVGWVRLSHGWRTRCPTRSVRWLARWRHPHPCRPLPPPLPPHHFLRPPCHHPHPLSSALMMWSCSLSLRSRIGKPVWPLLHISRTFNK